MLKLSKFKDIIISSLEFIVRDKRTLVYAFVIMNNHVHIIWQMQNEHVLADVQRSFMKYTAQMMLKELRNNHPKVLSLFRVDAKDRKYQVWERNPLSVALYSRSVFMQKLQYIHLNPVKAGVVSLPEEYRYSSAAYYYTGKSEWDFLSHYNG